jgi:hypothetical protein
MSEILMQMSQAGMFCRTNESKPFSVYQCGSTWRTNQRDLNACFTGRSLLVVSALQGRSAEVFEETSQLLIDGRQQDEKSYDDS